MYFGKGSWAGLYYLKRDPLLIQQLGINSLSEIWRLSDKNSANTRFISNRK